VGGCRQLDAVELDEKEISSLVRVRHGTVFLTSYICSEILFPSTCLKTLIAHKIIVESCVL